MKENELKTEKLSMKRQLSLIRIDKQKLVDNLGSIKMQNVRRGEQVLGLNTENVQLREEKDLLTYQLRTSESNNTFLIKQLKEAKIENDQLLKQLKLVKEENMNLRNRPLDLDDFSLHPAIEMDAPIHQRETRRCMF